MPKIVFLGAGSSVFAKNILGDCLLTPSLQESEIALYDIDPVRLEDSRQMLENLNQNLNKGRAKILPFLGIAERSKALTGANYVVNAIQVGGYQPSTVIDFDIPKKYGLKQTIADTLGIGGIFRALRTIPVMLDIAEEMELVCPDAWFLNYTNPMAMLSGAMLRASSIRTVGLCHSVQGCVPGLLWMLGLTEKYQHEPLKWKIAGINHQAWLLELTLKGRDLYPEIKEKARALNREARKQGAKKHGDMVRFDLMDKFGYYITESSEHNAEYVPYYIKTRYPQLIEEFNIPLDEYPRRCVAQIAGWEKQRSEIVNNKALSHVRTAEYGSWIMEAIETDVPYQIGGNVLNNGLITNLPSNAVVEVPCLVNRNGIQGCHVGELPEQCAALNRTNINVQLLTVKAALTKRKDHVYQAAMLDPHTSAELSLDDTKSMCDDLFEAHKDLIGEFE